MAVTQLDISQIASFCAVPETSLNALLDQPTKELVHSFLEAVAGKSQEYNQLSSEKLRADVELENAVRGGESKARLLKNSVDKAQKENSDLRQKLNAEDTTREAAEAELEKLRSSTSASTTEISTLQARVASLESSNRDTLALLDSKTTAYDSLVTDLNLQHQKTVELRREVSELEQGVQSANTTASNAKFHEQGLQQEIEQLKRSNDWFDRELKAKSDELSKHRKEKGLRISELQRENEDATGEISSLQKNETILRRRLEELGEKADSAFQKIQQLEESGARREESFKLELDASNRLQELTKKSAETEHQRQQDLLAELDALKEDMIEQTGRLAAEVETEHQEREAAEAKIAELEVQVEQLQTEVSVFQERERQPGTPHQGVNGFIPHTPVRGEGTPSAFSPGSTRSKGGLSMTQMYSNLNDVSRKLESEKRRNQELVNTIDNMINDMEMRGPEIEETRAEKNRLESEVGEISTLVETISQERDQAVKAAKRWEGQIRARATEAEVLRQQLRDLSSQIKVLLMEAHLRSRGQEEIGLEERARLEQIAAGQSEEERIEGETATARLISESLVTFRNISELQEQNANLLRITREVGERMEHEEALRKQTDAARNWEELQQKYERCKDEIKSLATQSQSYIRERDMFRRMLSRRGQIPHGHESMFDESVIEEDDGGASNQEEIHKSIEDGSGSRDHADYSKLLREFQSHFDAYKHEAETDKRTLKAQLDGITKDNSSLRSEVAKSSSQVSLAQERYELLQGNYSMLRNENSELQKRAQTYSENAAKQDIRVQQVAEDLIEARGLVDSMRNETANLKAEKEFWKSIEKRINEDNQNLLNERNRLNSLNTNLQNLLNEKEHSESETRRRLHSQIESTDKELQTTKTKLAEESEENKRLSQRREYDSERNQKRIDDLVTSLASIREELVEAKTTRDHLSTRVEELTIQLRSAEERASVVQAAPIAAASSDSSGQQQPSNNNDNTSLSREQELSVEISELKRDIDLAKSELTNSKSQIDQYKAISQASEDELASLNETQDLYREETEKAIAQKDSRIKELEQRIEDALSELSSTNSELGDLRNQQADFNRRLEEHKTAFDAELAQVKDEDERHAAAAQYYQEDLKVQADIAQQAQQNYENELLKHADAAKALQKVRSDYNSIKLEVAEVRTELETARANFVQSEESWSDSRERYDREISELKSTRTSLKTQNDHLHQQLENFTHRTQPSTGADSEQAPETGTEPGLANLQEVIKYIRREKEIVDVQLELSSQEAKRLRQQLDYTQNQLDETRLKLNQQRRLEADSERMALDHNKLMETINDLNTLRESNVTLRAESRQAQANLATRTKELEELRTQTEPLEAQVRELTLKCESQEEQAKLLKEDSDRWQQRAHNVLQKYDRVDPAELEALKEQLKAAESARDELTAAKQALQEQADNASTQVAQAQEQSNERVETMRTRLTEQFKGRSKQLSDRIREKDAALQTANSERQELEQRLVDLQGQLEKANAEKDASAQGAGMSVTHEDSEEGQISNSTSKAPYHAQLLEIQKKAEEAEEKARQEASEASKLRTDVAQSKARITELEQQLSSNAQIIDNLNNELSQLRTAQQQNAESSQNIAVEQVAKLQEELSLAQQDADKFRAAASISTALANSQETDGEKSVAQQVAEHVEVVRAELEAQHQEKVTKADEMLDRRTKQMKEGLTKKLTEGKAQIRQSLQEEHENTLQNLRDEHRQEVESLQIRHKEEIDELRKQEEELRAIARSGGDTQNAASEGAVKSEPEKATGPWQPSDQEIRALVQNSEVLRSILKGNVTRQVAKAKEEQATQLKEEHEQELAQRLADLQAKADAAKEHAVALEAKKTSLQINMQTNKAKSAQVKLDVVQKAAQETPQKSVEEVWAVAKDAKAPTGAPQPSQAQKVPIPATGTFGRPTPAMQPVFANQQGQQGFIPSAPPNLPPGATTFGRPSASIQSAQPNRTSAPQSMGPISNAVNPSQQIPQSQPRPMVAQTGPQATTNNHPNVGTGPAAGRGAQSSLPVARGGSIRGASTARGNPRGRGSGIARGGPQSIDTTQGQGGAQGRSSPTSALNASAKQFVPGNKRPREEGQEGVGGDGKRIRGISGEGGANS